MFGLGVRYIGVENARLAVAEFGGFPALWKYLQEESGGMWYVSFLLQFLFLYFATAAGKV